MTKNRGRPFQSGVEPRRGRGPRKGAPHAGRPPNWLKAEMALHRETAVEKIGKRLREDELDNDQLLKLVKEWAPATEERAAVEILITKDYAVHMRVPGVDRNA